VSPPIHQDVAPLAGLLGTWRGDGHGSYPTIEPFDYEETVTFSHVGKPFIAYLQRTKHATTGLPMHGEVGFWRMPGPARVEFVVAHPTGVAEVAEGTYDGRTIQLRSTSIVRTASAKEVSILERDFFVDIANAVLRYSLRMAAVGVPLTEHLVAELRHVNDGPPATG
jgi:hypothetical protein